MQQQIKQLLSLTIKKLQTEGKLQGNSLPTINVEPTKSSKHGDFASNVAMLLGKEQKCNPLSIAEAIAAEIPVVQQSGKPKCTGYIEKVEVAKPGFINFYLTDKASHEMIAAILQQRENFAHTDIGKNKMVMVEFVSANPTGPLHVGHGRGAAFGATIAELLKTQGFRVHREYYVNDAGRQMHVLALSVWLRYLELDREIPHFPDSGYKGLYIKDIATRLKAEYGEVLHRPLNFIFENLPADSHDGGDKEFYVDALVERAQSLLGKDHYHIIFQAGIDAILADIREDLEEFGVVFDEWFFESHLIKSQEVQKGIEIIAHHGYTYKKDGALWFRATDFGDEKDRVLVRSNGQTTYFASDIGYHLNKYERGFDKIIDIFGADHHGYMPRVKAFLEALKLDTKKLEILLVQFAILYRGKEKVSMSTRSGEFVTLRKLREEVGNDAARFFYIMRKNDQHLDFDLELAKSQSSDNPIYYIQYAHARIASVLRQAEEKNLPYDIENGLSKLHLLSTEHEKNLLRQISRYAIILQDAALNYEPHLLAHYLYNLANDFHTYYNAEQFLVADEALRDTRLCFIVAIKQLLNNGLSLLGVSSPETM
jgi:arginyl-tRNA synthetase